MQTSPAYIFSVFYLATSQRHKLLLLLSEMKHCQGNETFCWLGILKKNFIRFEFDETSCTALKKSASYFLHIFVAPRLWNLLVLSCLGLSGDRKVNKVKFDTFYSINVASIARKLDYRNFLVLRKLSFFIRVLILSVCYRLDYDRSGVREEPTCETRWHRFCLHCVKSISDKH